MEEGVRGGGGRVEGDQRRNCQQQADSSSTVLAHASSKGILQPNDVA